ncbi:MAG: phosphate-starvation-inducible PsiE family protein [Clostridium sp.]|nr:phosphate-starvation-inducible PsiE family protein [Clostridium sp.]
MSKKIKKYILSVSDFLETIIGILLAISIAILVIFLFGDLKLLILDPTNKDLFNILLASAFNLVIGIEFIKMLCKHSPDTVVEVLLFAIARQLIVEHTSTMENLMGIISIGILFAVRKYLFHNFENVTEKTIYRGNERVKRINLLEHVDIPFEDHETLEEVILKEVDKRELKFGTGVCIYYSGFALKIAKIRNHEITRVEVIKSID